MSKDSTRVLFAIRTITEAPIVGFVGLSGINPVHRSADMAVRIGDEFNRNKGYGKEALLLALDFGWKHLNLHRIGLTTLADNPRAIATFEAAGFVREGLARQAAFIDGKWHDVVIMGALSPLRRRNQGGLADRSEIDDKRRVKVRTQPFPSIMTERHTHLDALAMGLMVLFCAIWGLNQVAAKVTNDSISPLLQAGLRSAGAAVLLWIWCGLRGVRLFTRDGSLKAGLLAGLLFAGEFGTIFWGLKYTTASRGVLFLYTSPFIVAAGLHWLVPAERLRLPQVMGLLCAFVGVVAAFAEGARHAGDRQWIGDLMLLIAAAMWGGDDRGGARRPSVPDSAGQDSFLPIGRLRDRIADRVVGVGEPGFTNPTTLGLVSLAWQIVIVAFASYLGWFWLIAHYPATRLAAFSFLSPLFGMIFGAGAARRIGYAAARRRLGSRRSRSLAGQPPAPPGRLTRIAIHKTIGVHLGRGI